MRTVLDASVLVELLLHSPTGAEVADIARRGAGDLHIPHLADVEVASVLRGLVRAGAVSPHRAAGALADLADLPVTRWPAHPMLTRMWALRDSLAAYDATYIALAEALDASLVTADTRMARGAKDVSICEIVLCTPPEGGDPA